MATLTLGVDITVVKTSTEGPEFALGTEFEDPKTGKVYRYINADTAIADGDCLVATIGDADFPFALVPGAAVELPVRGVGIVAIANEGFGWVQIHGKKTNAKVADASAAGDFLVTSATAGRLATRAAFTTVDPTKAQLDAAFAACIGLRIQAITDGNASNLGDIWIER